VGNWTEFEIKKMIGQMIVVRASGYLFAHQRRYPVWEVENTQLKHWLETLNLGGVILLGGSAAELSLRTKQLQTWSNVPLLIAADIEEGVGQRFAGATWFPPPMALAAIWQQDPHLAQDYSYQMGAITAQEALAIGINWILAPVVDVNNNPDNPVINVRSFGDKPEIVQDLATAFIQGTKNYPILTTAKHFPGHGDTATDSHLELPCIPHSQERLQQIELPPFQAAIAAKVDSIMTAHLQIPAWDRRFLPQQDHLLDQEKLTYPATLSSPILTGQLRQDLGFDGLIVTDALIMGGVANYFSAAEIAVKAVEAGADILLMPADPVIAIDAVYEAVKSGLITVERIAESIGRINKAKEKISIENQIQEKSSWQFTEELYSNKATKTVKKILTQSMDRGGIFPIGKGQRNLIIVDDLLNCDFLDRQSPAVTIPKKMGYELQLVDYNTRSLVKQDHRPTLLQLFVRGNPFRGSAGLSEAAQKFYWDLINQELLQGLIIYGSPYIKDWFQDKIPPSLSWIFSYGQMAIAQQLACEALFNISSSSKEESDDFM
jgi:beta-glucosidase